MTSLNTLFARLMNSPSYRRASVWQQINMMDKVEQAWFGHNVPYFN